MNPKDLHETLDTRSVPPEVAETLTEGIVVDATAQNESLDPDRARQPAAYLIGVIAPLEEAAAKGHVVAFTLEVTFSDDTTVGVSKSIS